MRRFVRPAVALSGLALVALASGAGAATAGPTVLTVEDPKGDQLSTSDSDITSVAFTTTGKTTTTKVKGKSVTSYAPENLVVSMTLAAPPSALPGVLYQIDGSTSKCGAISLYYTADDSGSGAYVGCGSEPDAATGSTSTTLDVLPVVKDATITWTMPFDSLPREIKPGTSISGIEAFATQADPVFGLIGPYLLTNDANYDNAASAKSYVIG